MMQDPVQLVEPADQWLRLINAYLDDSITKNEFELLSEWLAASPDNAMWFARVATVHSGIRSTLQHQDYCEFLAAKDPDGSLELAVDPQNILEMLTEFDEAEQRREKREAATRAKRISEEAAAKRLEQLEHDRQNRPRRPQPIEIPRSALWIAVAATLFFALFVFDAIVLKQPKGQPGLVEVSPPVDPRPADTFVTLSDSVAAVWSGEASPSAGERLPAGRLKLVEGAVQLTFDDGADVICEAPMELELVSASRLWLERGKLVAKVPEEAIGFTVSTVAGSIVDLGTEFGVGVDEAGDTDVQVLEGVVALAAKVGDQDAPRLTLNRGMARHIQLSDKKINEIEFDPHAYLRNVPSSAYELAVMHDRPLAFWRFDGEGKTIHSIGRVESTEALGAGVTLVGSQSQSQVGSAAALFSGAHEGIQLTDMSGVSLTHDFTVEAWVKPTEITESTGAMRILSNFFRTPNGLAGWAFGVADERFVGAQTPRRVLLFTMHGVYDSISTQRISFDEWIHLAVSVDSRGRPSMYVNGSDVIEFSRDWKANIGTFKPIPADVDYSGSITSSSNPYFIGRHPSMANEGNPPEAWQGGIDELAVFNRVLTPEEIAEHYQASRK